MSKRYIDAYALENRVEDFEILTGMKFDIVHDFVSSQPTADVRENIRGEWIYSTNNESVCEEWTCSLCGTFSLENTNFCPNCGAQMKEE